MKCQFGYEVACSFMVLKSIPKFNGLIYLLLLIFLGNELIMQFISGSRNYSADDFLGFREDLCVYVLILNLQKC